MASAFTYAELLEATGGKPAGRSVSFARARISTDTRSIGAGDFFLPLSGERFDGHDYLPQAIASGALGAFVQQDKLAVHPEWNELPNLIAVPDPVAAYLDVARMWRRRIHPTVIAVTGSSGKTTTKEMLAAAFSPIRKTQKTEKNFNNEIGVSQTLLALEEGTEVLIVEMGMRGPRQIAPLSLAAEPDVAIVNNVGPAHIEMLGSLEAIAHAKLEIAEGLNPKTGVLVTNGDDTQLPAWTPKLWSGQHLEYHIKDASNIHPITTADGQDGIAFDYRGQVVTLSAPGEHMVSNALGVLKVGEALGIAASDLIPGLCAFQNEKGRWERQPLSGYQQVTVINDAYNANPDSARASLNAFLSVRKPGQKAVIVLGGMKELGDFSRGYHEALGQWLATQTGIDTLYTVGEEGRWLAEAAHAASYPVTHAEDIPDLINQLLKKGPLENTVIYLKGSRAYGLESVPELLQKASLSTGGIA